MGDSEDEYDRKRRDKFRGERGEASYRGNERIPRPREDWVERDTWARPRPRDYRGAVRDRGYSPSIEPVPKRMRHDYFSGDNFYNHFGSYQQPIHRDPPASTHTDGQQPPMMSFKAFLATQDDNISDSDAIEKYNDYKLEFQRQQLNEFFVAHKDDEWFRLKYHPEDSTKRKEQQMAALKKRLDVFMELLDNGNIGGVSIDCSRTPELLKVLDTVVIKLEGGTTEDLQALDNEYAEMEERSKENKTKEAEQEEPKTTEATKKSEEVKAEPLGSENESNGADVAKDVETEVKDENVEEKVDSPEEGEDTAKNEEESKEDGKKTVEEEQKGKPKSQSVSSDASLSSSSDSEEEAEKKEAETEKAEEDVVKKEPDDADIIHTIEDDKSDKPKFLHKTTSIFLRNLAPTITKQEIEAICVRYDGFLRVALADPQPERRWLRRGWVTFKRDSNIKEICWNLNNIRLRECELGAIVNRDLSRRIRPVNGITAHKQVVRSDIRISARVALHLDTKAGLWLEDDKKSEKSQHSFGLVSNNPVLHNITDYLIEEASAEEEELLGLEPTADTPDSVSVLERDESLISVLDRILLYLRIVHSVDYYNHCEYPNEDEMPNRCGILHARGPPPTSKTDMTQFIGNSMEVKMVNFLPSNNINESNKNESKLIKISLKDVNTEIDKFVQANTRELSKDKWLCPLSGKKFKGPDFVRKHIFNKHAEKIEEVKKEVEYFNNYLQDSKRPMLAETPTPKREEPPSYNHSSFGGSYGGYGRPPSYYAQSYSQRPRGFAPRQRGNPGDFRPVIHYRDLDAPREPEEFI